MEQTHRPSRVIAYFVHGRGRGHASRAQSVVPALRQAGHVVFVAACGDAIPALAGLGEVAARPLVRPGVAGYAELVRRLACESTALAGTGAQMVISDGDQGALLAARALGLPALAIGHDLVFTRCALPRGLRFRDLLHQRLNALVPTYLSDARVAVHFLPIEARDPHTRVARPELSAPASHPSGRRDHVVTYFRDRNAEPVLAAARAAGIALHAFGGAGGELVAREAFLGLLSSARAAIGSAGSNFMAECALSGTPVLALYRDDDPEQRLNAMLAAAAGFGLAASFSSFSPALLADFWQRARAGAFQPPRELRTMPSVVQAVMDALGELAPDVTA